MLFVLTQVSWIPGWPLTCYVGKNEPELLTCLLKPFKYRITGICHYVRHKTVLKWTPCTTCQRIRELVIFVDVLSREGLLNQKRISSQHVTTDFCICNRQSESKNTSAMISIDRSQGSKPFIIQSLKVILSVLFLIVVKFKEKWIYFGSQFEVTWNHDNVVFAVRKQRDPGWC